MTGLVGAAAAAALPAYIRWPLKLLGGIAQGVRAVGGWAVRYPREAALVLLALACTGLWIGWDRADAKRVEIRHQFDAFIEQAKTAATASKAAQEDVNAKQEQEWKDKADAADATIDDLRSDLAQRLRDAANRSATGTANPAAKDHSPGVSQSVPSAPAGTDGQMPVSNTYCWDAAKLADLSAYAIKAHEWAVSLETQK